MTLPFRTRLLALFGGLVIALQAATTFGILGATEEDAVRRTSDSLRVGAAVFHADLADREARLLDRVHLLSRDFAFIEAVATLDAATLRSVLHNHGARAEADIALLLSIDGEILASSTDVAEAGWSPIGDLLGRAEADGRATAMLIHNGVPYQAVLMPVYAPRPIAWLCMGFVIDDAVANAVKQKTHLEVSFFSYTGDPARTVLASTLPPADRARMAQILAHLDPELHPLEAPFTLPGTDYLTIAVPLDVPAASDADRELYAAIQTSMGAALAGHRRLRGSLVAITLAAFGVAAVIAFWIARSVTRPIEVLVAAAKRISVGDYERPIELASSDELGVLARTMNTMQAGIFAREEQIRFQTSHDPLTGLYSRAVVHEKVAQALDRAARAEDEVALLIISVDRFKEINDKFGHQTGDAILGRIAETLLAERQEQDTVIRLGGDEFLSILGKTTPSAAECAARRIERSLTTPVEVGGLEVTLELSVGIAIYPEHGDQSEKLLRRADIALLAAKREGGGVSTYRPGQDEEHLRKLSIIHDLGAGLESDEFHLVYQPKVDTRTRDVRQVEVLIRWESASYGPVRPDEFIPWAEESGKIRQITRWVLDTAIAQCEAWRSRGLHLPIAVNLSALDLADEGFVDQVMSCLARHGLPSSFLVLEVTETAVMRDLATARGILNTLCAHGVQVALDDFGTGHSSLAQLKQLRASELKIDRSFVCNLKEDNEDACIVRCAAEIGHALGMVVVAEGVEDARCFALIRELGGDLVQGYFISRPLPADALAEWVESYYREQVPPELASV